MLHYYFAGDSSTDVLLSGLVLGFVDDKIVIQAKFIPATRLGFNRQVNA